MIFHISPFLSLSKTFSVYKNTCSELKNAIRGSFESEKYYFESSGGIISRRCQFYRIFGMEKDFVVNDVAEFEGESVALGDYGCVFCKVLFGK